MRVICKRNSHCTQEINLAISVLLLEKKCRAYDVDFQFPFWLLMIEAAPIRISAPRCSYVNFIKVYIMNIHVLCLKT